MSDRNQELFRDARRERESGRPTQAKLLYRTVADAARAEGDILVLAHALRHISDIEQEEGHTVEALAAGREALALYRSRAQSSPLDIANALRVIALALMGEKAFEDSAVHWQDARTLYEKVGVQAGVQECDANLAQLNLAR